MEFKPYRMGKYLLLEKLATGGMAEVYRAKLTGASGFEKDLAIKKILPTHVEDETFQRMFETEARIGSRLNHPNIVPIFDFIKTGDTFLLVMEFVNGKNLRQVINKLKKLQFVIPLECTLFTVNEICKGLDYAHSKKDDFSGQLQNIIHRDMSPQNIMISYEGQVRIVDFGIANWKDKLEETKSGVIKGKFGYMSPEQASGEPISHLTDVFSTGIIFWELLTGRRLFTAESDFATLRLIQECSIPKPSLFNRRISRDLENIVLKALSKNTKQRYQSAGAMQRALQEYLNRNYPEFRQNSLSDLMQKTFEEEIRSEKRRIEQLNRQSLPFSQGNIESVDDDIFLDENEGSIEGSVTASDQDRISRITAVDSDRPSDPIPEVADREEKTKRTLENKAQPDPHPFSLSKKSLEPKTDPKANKASPLSSEPGEKQDHSDTLPKTQVAAISEISHRSSSKLEAALQEIRSERKTLPHELNSSEDTGPSKIHQSIPIDIEQSQSEGFSRDSWSTQKPLPIDSHSSETPEQESSKFPAQMGFLAASLLIAVTGYLYHLLLSGKTVIPVQVQLEDPRLIGSTNKPNKPKSSPSVESPSSILSNCEIKFETDPPGAIVIIDGVEKLSTPGTVLVPCDTSFNYSLQLQDYETVAENIFVKPKAKPIFKSLKKIETGSLVILANRRAKVYTETDFLGEIEPGRPFNIERLVANRKYRIKFVNEIFGIDETKIFEVKPGVSSTYEVRLDEKSEKAK